MRQWKKQAKRLGGDQAGSWEEGKQNGDQVQAIQGFENEDKRVRSGRAISQEGLPEVSVLPDGGLLVVQLKRMG